MRVTVRRLGVVAAAVVAAASLALPPAHAAGVAPTGAILYEGTPDAIADQYIVVLKETAQVRSHGLDTTVRQVADRYGARVRHSYRAALPGFAGRLSRADARRLAGDPAVAYVEQDQTMSLAGSQPSPPWGLDRIDQYGRALDGRYSYPAGRGEGVRAYVLDTGIRIDHETFQRRASYGRDVLDNDSVADDCNGHGTHVAGIIGGAQYGVAKGASLVAVRIAGCGNTTSVATLIAGVDWVTANAIRPAVANVSLAGARNQALETAVANSIASGIPYAVAAGNEASDACQYAPAAVPGAMTVGATNEADRRVTFSNYGSCLTLFAPGDNILSAWNTSTTAQQYLAGTSMAAPFVAGAAAVYLSSHRFATPAQVRTALVNDASPYPWENAGAGSPQRLLWLRGNLYHNRLTSAGAGQWEPNFRNSPDGIRSISGAVYGSGELNVFAVTGSGELWLGGQYSTGAYMDWRWNPLGAPPNLRSVTPAIGPLGELEAFATDENGVIHHAYRDSSGWHGWWANFDWSPAGMSAVVAGRGPGGELELLATDRSGVLYRDYFDGSWHGWTPYFDGAPGGMRSVALGSAPWGSLEAFAVGWDGTVYHNVKDSSGWHGWTPQFDGLTQPVSQVALALGGVGALEVFALGNDGSVHHNFLNSSGWHGWAPNFDGAPALVGSLTVAASPTGSLEVFAVAGTTKNVYRNYLNGSGWHGWERNFAGVPDRMASVAALPGAAGALELYAIPLSTTSY